MLPRSATPARQGRSGTRRWVRLGPMAALGVAVALAALLGLRVLPAGLRSAPGTSDAYQPRSAGAVSTPAPRRTGTAPSKVMIILEENHTRDQILGSALAPYLNRLASTFGYASAMDAGYPTRCPSLAAYILLTSGSTHGICDDNDPSHHPLAGDNIFNQVDTAGLTWRNYAEDAPEPCATHNSTDGVFLVRHTPAAYYLTEQTRCRQADIPLGGAGSGALSGDITAGRLPAYAFVSPDACHDMHAAPPCPGHSVEAGDAWLAQWMPRIISGPDFQAGRLLVIITWDEGSSTSNHIPTLLLAAGTRHLTSAVPYTHCSTLATAEDVLRLPRLGCAATAQSLRTAFHL